MTRQENNNFKFHHIREPIGYFYKNVDEIDCDYWSDICYDYKKINNNKTNRSGAYGYQSPNDIHTHTEFIPLVNLLIKQINLTTTCFNNKIHGMWLNISPKGSFNRPHTHRVENYNKSYSGVLYLKVPSNSGDIVFMDPLQLNHYKKVNVKQKDILLFNDIIPHYVEPNQSNEDRISIAFNYV
jgi:hypothetical protein